MFVSCTTIIDSVTDNTLFTQSYKNMLCILNINLVKKKIKKCCVDFWWKSKWGKNNKSMKKCNDVTLNINVYTSVWRQASKINNNNKLGKYYSKHCVTITNKERWKTDAT